MPRAIMDRRAIRMPSSDSSTSGKPMEAAMDPELRVEGHAAHTPYCSKYLHTQGSDSHSCSHSHS